MFLPSRAWFTTREEDHWPLCTDGPSTAKRDAVNVVDRDIPAHIVCRGLYPHEIYILDWLNKRGFGAYMNRIDLHVGDSPERLILEPGKEPPMLTSELHWTRSPN